MALFTAPCGVAAFANVRTYDPNRVTLCQVCGAELLDLSLILCEDGLPGHVALGVSQANT